MSDNGDLILAAIERLGTGLERLENRLERVENGQVQLRVDLMARMDRLQHRMDGLDEHLTLGLGHADRAEAQARAAIEANRITAEQVVTLEKLVRKLEARIVLLEERQA